MHSNHNNNSEISDVSKIIKSYFDSSWYLNTYPDVYDAGIDAFVHYINHGRYEGRWPFKMSTLCLEQSLWKNDSEHALDELEKFLKIEPIDSLESLHAAWVLARWHSSYGRWKIVMKNLKLFNSNQAGHDLIPHLGPKLLEFSALYENGHYTKASKLIDTELLNRGELPDLYLAASSVSKSKMSLSLLNKIFINSGLYSIVLINPEIPKSIDNLETYYKCTNTYLDRLLLFFKPCVSIIIPTYNAGNKLITSLKSIQTQTWQNLDIIIVDDASTDNTYQLADSFAQMDPRIRVFRNSYNQGAYASRNKGLSHAKGKFITTHDSDDWSHPQKIELQVNYFFTNKKIKATISHWVRCTPDMVFSHWRIRDSWIYRNMSSLMFNKSVFKKIGYWDRVKVGADTEYLHRIQKIYGSNAIQDVMPGIPLSFGRHHPNSLSQDSKTHLRTLFKGLRCDYRIACLRWYDESMSSRDLYLPVNLAKRPFLIPAEQIVPPHEETIEEHFRSPELSHLIDPDWYINRYSDVAAADIEPGQHYLLYGGFEERDPGPNFSSAGYVYKYLKEAKVPINALVHYLAIGKNMNYETLPVFKGHQAKSLDKKSILVCAHSASTQSYGAERSFLNVLQGLNRIGFNTYVTMPSIGNEDYINSLRDYSISIKILPYSWWKNDNQPCRETIVNFERFIREQNINTIYVNTLMLWEPLLAASACNIKSIVHARELPEHDPDLCTILNADAETIRQHVTKISDYFIANSDVVAKYLSVHDRTTIVPNMVDADFFDLRNDIMNGSPTVAMISSNIPKKGLDDFVSMATKIAVKNPDIKCLLIGPENEHITELRQKQNEGAIPGNIQFSGYIESSQDALARANIVVNLSLFQESFGRTILEAMAARRPVIGYDWGALPELIRDGENGYLIPFRDIQTLADRLLLLCQKPDLIIKMGEEGRKIAIEHYGFDNFTSQLNLAMNKIL
jgi:glycosyltransferase involved in cell wall biosynthesis